MRLLIFAVMFIVAAQVHAASKMEKEYLKDCLAWTDAENKRLRNFQFGHGMLFCQDLKSTFYGDSKTPIFDEALGRLFASEYFK